jgi:hypothetical protein
MLIQPLEPLEAVQALGAEVSMAKAQPPKPFDAVVDLVVDGRKRSYVVEVKSRAPFPSELEDFLARRPLRKSFHPLLITSYMPESVGQQLSDKGWSWIDEVGNIDVRGPGLRLRQRRASASVPKRKMVRIPQGPGALRIIRFLISHLAVPLGATHLANIARVSQPRASQIMKQLRELDLVRRSPEGWEANREALLDAFLSSYRGPGGSESYYYSLEPPLYVAREISMANRVGVYVSADVGPDLIVPWRRPTHLITYAKRRLRVPEGLAVTATGPQDANVILRAPDDDSIFCSVDHRASAAGIDYRLAEHTQMIWDLLALGGDDRREAAEQLRKWLMAHP